MKFVWFLVEGDEDERFLTHFLDRLAPKFHSIAVEYKMIQYAKKKSDDCLNTIRSLRGMDNDYFILMDKDQYPCCTHCKEVIRAKIGNEADDSRIIVVEKEIEAWYLAGFTTSPLIKNLTVPSDTNGVDKQRFEQLVKSKTKLPLREAKNAMLKEYDIEQGRQRNRSLDYFLKKIEALIEAENVQTG
ncbi:MAG: hypothetical protein KIT45_14510 [Fimbriimonadia bacterium]|nr:hypothetical protein [Fimbriimonadia bacterium]